jgi:hypothetical protein
MRKYLALIVVGALTFGVVSFATAGEETQIEEASVKPKKLPKKKHKNIKYVNTITTFPEAATGQPKSAQRTILDFPKQFKINHKKVPYCKTDAAGLEGAATTQDAIAMCGKKSRVSDPKGSSAQVMVGTGPGSAPIIIDVDVTGFNENGKKLLLYSKPTGDAAGIPASILVGKLKKSKSGKKHKQALDVAIPPLAAGAISFFEVTIPKSKYVQAKCKPKKMTWQAQTFFTDGTSTTDDYSMKCKVKR